MDVVRKSRLSRLQLDEKTDDEASGSRRNSFHDDGTAIKKLSIEMLLNNERRESRDKPKPEPSHQSRPSMELFQLSRLNEIEYESNSIQVLPSPNGLRSRPSTTIVKRKDSELVQPNLLDINSSLLDSDDSDIMVVLSDQAEGYESDASNITTFSVQSNWDQYFDRKKPLADIFLERGDRSETASLVSDWDEDLSENEKKSVAFRALKNRASNSIEIEAMPNSSILVVCKKKKHVTRARIISMDTTLAALASWVSNDTTQSLVHRSENFSYKTKRYNSSKLGVSISELFTKPLDSSSQGLLILYGPVNGKLTYKILLTKVKELRRLCKQDGIDYSSIFKENRDILDIMSRRDTVEDIKSEPSSDCQSPKNELPLESLRSTSIRTIDL